MQEAIKLFEPSLKIQCNPYSEELSKHNAHKQKRLEKVLKICVHD